MAVPFEPEAQFAANPARKEAAIVNDIRDNRGQQIFVFAIPQRLEMDQPGAREAVPLCPRQGDLAFQAVNIGQAVIQQIGVVAGPFGIKGQLIIIAQGKGPGAKQIPPACAGQEIIPCVGSFKRNPSARKGLAIAQVQRFGARR